MYTYLAHDSEPSVGAVFGRSIKAALVTLVPCAIALGVLAEPICRAIFGPEFADGAVALRLLAPAVVLLSVVTLSASLIVSRRGAALMVWVTAGMVALNVALNLVLVPTLADRGAAAAMLVTEILFVAVTLTIAVRMVGGLSLRAVLTAPAAAGVAMVAPLVVLGDLLPVALLLGGGVYLAVLVLVERRLNPADLLFVTGIVKRRLRLRAGAS